MTITIQKEDIALACKAKNTRLRQGLGLAICVLDKYCPAYQALKRSGIPVSTVGWDSTYCRDGHCIPHTPELRKIVDLGPYDWPKALSMSFEWPEVR